MTGQPTCRTFSMTLLAMYSPSLSVQLCEVTGINLLLTKELYCTSCFWQPDLSPSTFFSCHYWSRILLGRGGCTNTTNTIYKTHKFLYLGLQQRKAIQLLEEWRSRWYNQSIPMVTADGIISPYLWLPFNLELNEMKLAVQTPFQIQWC